MGAPLCQGVRKAGAILVRKASDIVERGEHFYHRDARFQCNCWTSYGIEFGEDYLV